MVQSQTKVTEKAIIPYTKAPMMDFNPLGIYPTAIIIVVIIMTIVIIINNMNLKSFWKFAKGLMCRFTKMLFIYLLPTLIFWVILRTPFMAVSNFISSIFFPEESLVVDLAILFFLCLVMMFILAHSGIITFHRRRNGLSVIKYLCLHLPAWLFAWICVVICQIPSINFFFVQHGVLSRTDNIAAVDYANQQWSVVAVLILVPIAFICLCKIWQCIEEHFYNKSSTPSSYGNILSDTRALENWLKYEDPIEFPEQDVCGHKIVSCRIAKILLQTNNKKLQKIGLSGSYGSGKSSVLKLLSYYLQHPGEVDPKFNERENQFIICTISTWGQRNESKVSEFVLEEVVKTIEREFNCLEIVGLPKTYQLAISASDSNYATFLAALLMSSRLRPDEALRKLDRLMHDVGRKLVIYLEDCDRNHEQHQFWLEISTLLDRIGDLYNVSFVFAVGEMKNTLEILTKITDHTEIIPKIPEKNLNLILKNFHIICKVDFSDNPYSIFALSTMSNSAQCDILKKMIPHPRVLKRVLMDVFRTWNSLRDEINFEDLFLICLLKAEAPKVYTFIGDNIDSIRNSFGYNDNMTEKIQYLGKINWEWQDSIGETLQIDKATAFFVNTPLYWNIVEYIFPVLCTLSRHGRHERYTRRSSIPLNGISSSGPTDYWIRLHAGEIPSKEITDHEIRILIEEIQAGQYDNAVAKIIEDKIFGDKILQLGESIFNDQFHIQFLVEKIITALIKKNQLQIDNRNCAFINDCHSAISKFIELDDDDTASFDSYEYTQWILKIIRETMEYNMLYSNDFYLRWGTIPHGKHKDFANNFISVINEVFSDNPEKLLISLRNSPYKTNSNSTLTSLFLSYPECRYYSWHFLIAVIMNAAAKDEDLIIPQIADLIFRITPNSGKIVKVECREWNMELFGEYYKYALQLIHDYDLKNGNQCLCEAFAQYRSAAHEALKKCN